MNSHRKTAWYHCARDIAEYYGFLPLIDAAKSENGRTKAPEGMITRPALMEWFLKYAPESFNQPLLIYRMEHVTHEKIITAGFSLEIIGVQKSAAEAVLFQIASAILEETGFLEFSFQVNSLGDRESIARFNREFSNYYRTRVSDIPNHCRNNLKKDVFKVLACANERCMLIKDGAPKPIGTLSEGSRDHLTEVLNFLEGMKHQYRINDCLVGGKEFYTKTIYEIVTDEKTNPLYPKEKIGRSLAKGGRYDDLAKRLGCKKDVPAAGITITFGGLGIEEGSPRKKLLFKKKKFMASLVQVGFEAKLQSLAAAEILRKAKIPIEQSLLRDRLSSQMTGAEQGGAPYLIIIGQKEALEHTAIVRNMESRCQETILLEKLPKFLRRKHA